MDHEKIEKAVQLFLEGIGEDCTREGLAETQSGLQICVSSYLAAMNRMQKNICHVHFMRIPETW